MSTNLDKLGNILELLDQGLGSYIESQEGKAKNPPKPELILIGVLNDAALNTLTPREEKVIKLFYGYNCNKHQPKAIGKHFGVSEERIYQILARAHRKLNHPSRLKLMATA